MPNKNPLFWKWFVGPAFLYLAIWIIYTYPTVTSFSSHFFADDGDGLQNVWNIWWINKSLTSLQQLPYFTQFLHLPGGVTLVGQTMNPFNGLVSITLLPFLTLTQAHNTMYVLAFALGGVTAFWLAYEFSKSYWLSLLGGFLFTFSTFHTSHGMGHLQLTTLQWVPLFVLLWWRLLKNPTPPLAIGSAITFFLVQMSDLYYFFYSIMTAGILGLYLFVLSPEKISWLKTRILALVIFGFIAVGLTAPLMQALVGASTSDPFLGNHEAITYSADLLSIFNPPPSLRIGALTNQIWPPFAYINVEGYIYLGLSVIAICLLGLFLYQKLKGAHLSVWYVIAVLFGVLSLGPKLHVNGTLYDSIILPYQLLENMIPPLKLSGVPVRMIFMTTLACAVIVPIVLSQLVKTWRLGAWITGLFIIIMVIEFWPAPNYLTSNHYADYAYVLKNLPPGNVIDLSVSNQNMILYQQTLHEKPLAYGSISRTPMSIQNQNDSITSMLNANQFEALNSKLDFRYLVTPATTTLPLEVVYKDATATIYQLKGAP